MSNDVAVSSSAVPAIPESYLVRLREMLKGGSRKIIGLVGPPGAGKSTVGLALREIFSDISQIVPMDGFHLANVELARLGRAHRKGAPDTFDSAGYVDLLKRLHSQAADEIIYAPEFRREIEEPIAGAIPIFPETQLLITEGNYRCSRKATGRRCRPTSMRSGTWTSRTTCASAAWPIGTCSSDGRATKRSPGLTTPTNRMRA